MTRRQLLALGFGADAIKHRVASGRLHPVARGVYAVGRPELRREGHWTAAVLVCGEGAALSHRSAAGLWEIGPEPSGVIEVSIRRRCEIVRRGLRARSRPSLPAADVTAHRAIPVTTPARTILDLATLLGPKALERIVNRADARDLLTPPELHSLVNGRFRGRRGAAPLRALLDPLFFRLSDSNLELLFRPLGRRAGLPEPQTQVQLNGFRVDFHYPTLRLVVETDSLRYHRTPATQRRDALRDQAHTAAGFSTLRFTHWQVAHEPEHVISVLRRTAANRFAGTVSNAPL